ncbi:MAG TPA: hypothetical protein ENK67_05580 [Flavobacteriia bacterium]|nr:hypothetical protein [Flavobacteriia bacterium]
MKKLQQIFSVIIIITGLIFITTFSSCSDDSNELPDGVLKAKVDGVSFISIGDEVQATYIENYFNITAKETTTGKQIIMTLHATSDISTGTYDLTVLSFDEAYAGAFNINENNAFVSNAAGGSGELTLSKFDLENHLVSGTFHFIAVRAVDDNNNALDEPEIAEVTEGEFNNVILSTELGGPNNSNTLSATVDGTDFDFDVVNGFENLGVITITANISDASKNISLVIPNDTTTGTFELGNALASYKGTYNPDISNNQAIYAPGGLVGNNPGELNLTVVDLTNKHLEGTFSFTAERISEDVPDVTYEITNGSFSVDY